MKRLLFVIFTVVALSLVACSSFAEDVRRQVGQLVVYSPKYSRIDLVCGEMPSINDTSVLFCAEAAYTGELLNKFKHSNIAGDHVSGGVRYKGYPCRRNTGAFVFYNGNFKFLYDNYSAELNNAAQYGGMGFAQECLIHNGKRVPCKRPDTNVNKFRALCEINGKLCVVDSKSALQFGFFVAELLKIGVTNALYLDMGPGWNYSWWRDADNTAHEIHTHKIPYTTNWVTFYR